MRNRVRIAMASILVFSLAMVAPPAQGQSKEQPLTEGEIIRLLQGGVAPARVASIVHDHGISFEVTPQVEKDLRDAGGTDELIEALHQVAPKPTAAAVLIVESKPGGAQVFVDDGLIARTSPEGRLKISSLTPGTHRLRLAREGYRDYEQTLDLSPGSTTVAATLEAIFAAPPATSKPEPVLTPRRTVPKAYFGVLIQDLAPEAALTYHVPDAKGAFVKEVAPNSPAAAAGIQPGDVIRAFNDQPLENAGQLKALVGAQEPGTDVKLEFVRNGNLQSVVVRLVERPGVLGKQIHFNRGPLRGLTLEELDDTWRKGLNLPPSTEGVVVNGIEPNSPAAHADVHNGDVIVEVNRRKVRSIRDFPDLSETARANLLLLRVGKTMDIELHEKP